MARAACPDSICARATRGDHGLEQGARLSVPAQAQQQLRANACGIQPVGLAGLKALHAQRGGLLEVLGLDGVENGFEMDLAQARQAQALEQRAGREGLEQVAVQGRLGSLGHGGIRRLGRDHEEHRGKRQRLRAPQVVQQGLARVVGLAKKLVAQHVVEHRVLQPGARVLHTGALHDAGHAVFAQLSHQDAARCGIAVHDQRLGRWGGMGAALGSHGGRGRPCVLNMLGLRCKPLQPPACVGQTPCHHGLRHNLQS